MNQRIDYLYAAFSGFLLILIFPTVSLSLVAWIALVPLLIVLPGKDFRSAGKLGFVTGFIYFYGVLYWLNVLAKFEIVMIPATVVLVAILAIYVSAFAILFTWLLQKYPNGIWWLTPIIWTTLEYIRELGPLGFPWGLIGYSQAPNLKLIQICSITGVLGISFLVILMNGLIAQFTIEWKRDSRVYRKTLSEFVILFLLLGLIYIYGTGRINQLPSNSIGFTAGIVQGNIPQMMKWDPEIADENFQKHIELSKELIKQKPQLIVWPETAITDIFSENESYQNQLIDFASTYQVNLLCGTLDGNIDENQFYNAVYLIQPNGSISQKYYKTHLVPFGEYLPLESVFPSQRYFAVSYIRKGHYCANSLFFKVGDVVKVIEILWQF